MKAPRSVRIGPHTWRVRRRELRGDAGTYGRTFEHQLLIVIAPGGNASQDRDTVLHEVLHAVWAHAALDLDDEQQERVVRSLATPLLGVLRDNPELVAFLTER